MIYTGLDWSGSPGPVQGSHLVFAAVHVDAVDISALDTTLAALRQHLRLTANYVFSRNHASGVTLQRFFQAIQAVQFTAHVHVLDKNSWAAQQVGNPTGAKCLCDGIVTLATRCPDAVVGGQILFIDLSSNYEDAITMYRTEIRNMLRQTRPRRSGYRDVRPCPDHRIQGGIIQVADMIAGEVRANAGTLGGMYLPVLGGRIQLV